MLLNVPRVITDAFQAVKSLGYKYPWVNRYCIPQDNEAEKEFASGPSPFSTHLQGSSGVPSSPHEFLSNLNISVILNNPYKIII
jgi:hypothetical protein